MFDLNKEVKEKLFNGLADWIIDKEPNYPSFAECKLWIRKQNSQYIITKNDEKEILMYLTYLPTVSNWRAGALGALCRRFESCRPDS